MASCPRLRPPRSFCRRAVHRCSNDGAVGGLFLAAAAMTLHRFPSLGLKSRINARKREETGKTLHRFASLSLKSRINARKRGVNRQNLASIPKFHPEIKNRCMQEGVNREILASIPKSGPEITNQCSRGVVAVENGLPASVVAATRSASDSNREIQKATKGY